MATLPAVMGSRYTPIFMTVVRIFGVGIGGRELGQTFLELTNARSAADGLVIDADHRIGRA